MIKFFKNLNKLGKILKKNCFFLLYLFTSDFVFPENYLNNPNFIAQGGFGKSEVEAQQNALSSLSNFFQMTISVNSMEKTTVADAGSYSTIFEEVFVQSKTELFAVHFTKAKFDRKQKIYETIAFIDREEAWKVYKPKLENNINSFEDFYSNAQNQKEVLLQVTGLQKAEKFAKENNLEDNLNFALIIYPESECFYEKTRNHISRIEPLIKQLCGTFTIQIECENDFNNSAVQAAKSTFEKIGIFTTESGGEYVCCIKIRLNKKNLPAGYFYTPAVTIEVLNGERIIFSSSEQMAKIGAKNKQVAEQRAYFAISECVSDLLNKEFMSNQT